MATTDDPIAALYSGGEAPGGIAGAVAPEPDAMHGGGVHFDVAPAIREYVTDLDGNVLDEAPTDDVRKYGPSVYGKRVVKVAVPNERGDEKPAQLRGDLANVDAPAQPVYADQLPSTAARAIAGVRKWGKFAVQAATLPFTVPVQIAKDLAVGGAEKVGHAIADSQGLPANDAQRASINADEENRGVGPKLISGGVDALSVLAGGGAGGLSGAAMAAAPMAIPALVDQPEVRQHKARYGPLEDAQREFDNAVTPVARAQAQAKLAAAQATVSAYEAQQKLSPGDPGYKPRTAGQELKDLVTDPDILMAPFVAHGAAHAIGEGARPSGLLTEEARTKARADAAAAEARGERTQRAIGPAYDNMREERDFEESLIPHEKPPMAEFGGPEPLPKDAEHQAGIDAAIKARKDAFEAARKLNAKPDGTLPTDDELNAILKAKKITKLYAPPAHEAPPMPEAPPREVDPADAGLFHSLLASDRARTEAEAEAARAAEEERQTTNAATFHNLMDADRERVQAAQDAAAQKAGADAASPAPVVAPRPFSRRVTDLEDQARAAGWAVNEHAKIAPAAVADTEATVAPPPPPHVAAVSDAVEAAKSAKADLDARKKVAAVKEAVKAAAPPPPPPPPVETSDDVRLQKIDEAIEARTPFNREEAKKADRLRGPEKPAAPVLRKSTGEAFDEAQAASEKRLAAINADPEKKAAFDAAMRGENPTAKSLPARVAEGATPLPAEHEAAKAPVPFKAEGETHPLVATNGKFRYRVETVPTKDVLASNTTTGAPTPGYRPEFQSRDFDLDRAKGFAKNIDPDQLRQIESTPTIGAPITWREPETGLHHVIAGNHRSVGMMLSGKYADAMPVRVLEGSLQDAQRLAAASQESTAGAQTLIEKARGAVRAAGIMPEDLKSIRDGEPIRRDNVGVFLKSNPALEAKLFPNGRPLDHAAAEQVNSALVGLLPESVQKVVAHVGEKAEQAIAASAPSLLYLKQQAKAGKVHGDYDLLPAFETAAKAFESVAGKGKSGKALVTELNQRVEQGTLVGDKTSAIDLGTTEAGIVLGLASMEARANPAQAMADAFKNLVDRARDDSPQQSRMFGEAVKKPTASSIVRTMFGERIAEAASKVRVGNELPETARDFNATPALKEAHQQFLDAWKKTEDAKSRGAPDKVVQAFLDEKNKLRAARDNLWREYASAGAGPVPDGAAANPERGSAHTGLLASSAAGALAGGTVAGPAGALVGFLAGPVATHLVAPKIIDAVRGIPDYIREAAPESMRALAKMREYGRDLFDTYADAKKYRMSVGIDLSRRLSQYKDRLAQIAPQEILTIHSKTAEIGLNKAEFRLGQQMLLDLDHKARIEHAVASNPDPDVEPPKVPGSAALGIPAGRGYQTILRDLAARQRELTSTPGVDAAKVQRYLDTYRALDDESARRLVGAEQLQESSIRDDHVRGVNLDRMAAALEDGDPTNQQYKRDVTPAKEAISGSSRRRVGGEYEQASPHDALVVERVQSHAAQIHHEFAKEVSKDHGVPMSELMDRIERGEDAVRPDEELYSFQPGALKMKGEDGVRFVTAWHQAVAQLMDSAADELGDDHYMESPKLKEAMSSLKGKMDGGRFVNVGGAEYAVLPKDMVNVLEKARIDMPPAIRAISSAASFPSRMVRLGQTLANAAYNIAIIPRHYMGVLSSMPPSKWGALHMEIAKALTHSVQAVWNEDVRGRVSDFASDMRRRGLASGAQLEWGETRAAPMDATPYNLRSAGDQTKTALRAINPLSDNFLPTRGARALSNIREMALRGGGANAMQKPPSGPFGIFGGMGATEPQASARVNTQAIWFSRRGLAAKALGGPLTTYTKSLWEVLMNHTLRAANDPLSGRLELGLERDAAGKVTGVKGVGSALTGLASSFGPAVAITLANLAIRHRDPEAFDQLPAWTRGDIVIPFRADDKTAEEVAHEDPSDPAAHAKKGDVVFYKIPTNLDDIRAVGDAVEGLAKGSGAKTWELLANHMAQAPRAMIEAGSGVNLANGQQITPDSYKALNDADQRDKFQREHGLKMTPREAYFAKNYGLSWEATLNRAGLSEDKALTAEQRARLATGIPLYRASPVEAETTEWRENRDKMIQAANSARIHNDRPGLQAVMDDATRLGRGREVASAVKFQARSDARDQVLTPAVKREQVEKKILDQRAKLPFGIGDRIRAAQAPK